MIEYYSDELIEYSSELVRKNEISEIDRQGQLLINNFIGNLSIDLCKEFKITSKDLKSMVNSWCEKGIQRWGII